ncbi:MAG: DUF393 domain-containing protein [Alphaproteobacteria bacterium]|nr:DUF393 domain-containing protein [Alphaproteobacteria bacterium]
MITVFYDGKCGLCRREIAHYKKTAPEGVFDWVDITTDTTLLEQRGISYTDALKRLHVVDAQGKLHVGVGAFSIIWQQMPRWRILAAIVSAPIIRSLAQMLYDAFARWRFNRLSHCKVTGQFTQEKGRL